jgi:hypothetical protein
MHFPEKSEGPSIYRESILQLQLRTLGGIRVEVQQEETWRKLLTG